MLERYRQDKWHRLNFQLQVVNEEQVKTWDRLAEGPKREHVATAAEREQAPWPPPSIPICRKQKDGTKNMCVHKEATLLDNHRVPTGSGKIGEVGRVERTLALHHFPSSHIEKPAHSTLTYLERDAASRQRQRDVQRALHDLNWVCR